MEFADLQQQADECLTRDKYDEAIALYDRCIEIFPNIIPNYGKLLLALILGGRELEAKTFWLSALLELKTEEIEEWTAELINVLQAEGIKRLDAGKYEEAEIIYLEIIEQQQNNGEAYKNLGNAVFNQGKLEEAIDYYQKGLSLAPDDRITYYHLGIVFQQQEKLEEAIDYYQKFLSFKPDSDMALNNLGNAFQKQGKIDEAIVCFQQALTLAPNDAVIYHNLGQAFQKQGKLEEAIDYYQQALKLTPNDAMIHNRLGITFQSLGKIDEAIACFQQSLKLNPNDVIAHNYLGLRFLDKREFDKAMSCYDRATEIDPDYAVANWNRALLLLLLGDYERGFADYEWRWRREETPPRPFPQPLWDGRVLESSTILLHAEQGFGDTIQFIRYAPIVAQRVGHVVVECHEPLVKLLTTVSGIERIVARETTLPQFDVQAPLLSLPYILGTTIETVPDRIPYLSPLEPLSFRLEIPPETCLTVGLVWAGNPKHPHDRSRSCSLNHFSRLFNISGIAFYSLQKEPTEKELTQLSGKVPLRDLSGQLGDFADTAAVVAQLDLIITVDTAVAHLAGALGRSVWVLLSFSHDWRWAIGREDSPWYPSMRLFRQNQPGNWEELLERVAKALEELANSRLQV